MDLLAGLNPAQRDAVLISDGPLLILAGPGSGKTRVIAHRIAHLVADKDVAPWRILAVTFTNKAARELRERVHALLGVEAESVALGTFHAICSRILRVDGGAIGIERGFTIYDDSDQMTLIKQAFVEVGIDPKRVNPRAVLSVISRAKSEMVKPSRAAGDLFQEAVARVYDVYQRLLEENKALDFDDLITRTVELFQLNETALTKYQQRYRYVMVDEFQDTNIAQYVLTRLLAAGHGNICVVGDPDQSIYAWRAADVRNILDFERDHPGARVVLLEQNYRSTQTILDTAHSVISRNASRKDKALWTENGHGQPVALLVGYDEQDEARMIADEIDRAIKAGNRRPRDYAVMYRTNAQSRVLEEAFVARRMPYRLIGGTRFYQRREIKDCLAYLRVVNNPFDSVSLLRVINVPPRGIGQKTIDDLTRWAQSQSLPLYSALQLLEAAQHEDTAVDLPLLNLGTSIAATAPAFQQRTQTVLLRFLRTLNALIARSEQDSLSEFLEYLLVITEYETFLKEQFDDGSERWENVRELIGVMKQYEEHDPNTFMAVDLHEQEGGGANEGQSKLAAFLEDVSLVTDVDELEDRADAITLITLHAAKGLEFPVVFITGLEEGLLPHMRSYDDPTQMEEERRLCYVGITRAKDSLYLTRARRRMLMGAGNANPTSRFLKDIPAKLIASRESGGNPTAPISYGLLQVHQRAGAVADGMSRGSGPRDVPEELAFGAGDQVRHAKFGDGIVIDCKVAGADQEITVSFKGQHGMKKLLLSFAPMERISKA
jgi:DNA helicase-2/ATP-dependent DNA helicase PcrA